MINQSDNAYSITHSHSQTQIDLFQRLLKQMNVDSEFISVIEAHETGTQVSTLHSDLLDWLVLRYC